MSRKYLSCAETAKLVRQSLKESFPSVKFSVRSDTYAGGASIRVNWIDGPTSDQVEAVVGVFAGSYFDGSIDYQGGVYAMLDGVPVRFGANFIFCNREYSDAMLARTLGRVARTLGGMALPTVADYRTGRLHSWQQSGGCDVSGEVHHALARHTCTLTGKSKTAGRAFVTHDDGYSRAVGAGYSAVAGD